MNSLTQPWTVDRVMSDLDDIVEYILNLLPMISLHQCARVCKKWNAICEKIKKTRHQLVWLLTRGNNSEKIQEETRRQIEVIPMEPKFALMFCSNQMFETQLAVPSNTRQRVSRFPRAAKMGRIVITDYLHKVLPHGCPIVGSATDGIVGTSPTRISSLELENTSAIACLLLPHLDNVTVTHFLITPEKERLLAPHITPVDTIASDVLSDVLGLPQGKPPKLVLLFETEKPLTLSRTIDIDYLLLRCFENIVIAGGYVDDVYPETEIPDADVGDASCVGVAFCGENIKVASVMLGHNVHTKSDAEQRLKRLKDCHIPTKNRMGFMFACIGRGEHYYREKNIESAAFHSLFPGVPLFGFFGNGEIGYDYLPDYSSADGEQNYSLFGEYPDDESDIVFDMPAINHSYTTIFVLMSLGNSL